MMKIDTMKSLVIAGAIGAALSFQAATVSANTLYNAEVTSITGIWTSVTNGINVTGLGSSSISWGTGGQSGYDFLAANTPINGIVPDGPTFVLGDFTHRNQPINAGTSITAAQLNVTVSGKLTDPGSTPFSVNSVFQFNHNETSNSWPCAQGSVSVCDDIVTAALNQAQSTSIQLDNVEYFFSIEGFKVGGNTFNQFMTEEGKRNRAQLVGAFTSKPTVVPIPAAAWLFGSALMGMTGLGYRRRRAT